MCIALFAYESSLPHRSSSKGDLGRVTVYFSGWGLELNVLWAPEYKTGLPWNMLGTHDPGVSSHAWSWLLARHWMPVFLQRPHWLASDAFGGKKQDRLHCSQMVFWMCGPYPVTVDVFTGLGMFTFALTSAGVFPFALQLGFLVNDNLCSSV